MKKMFVIFYSCILLFITNANGVSIKTIKPNTTLYGTKYFPLFLGEEWEWKLSDSDNIALLKWKIISLCTIDDATNDLSNVIGFKVDINDTASEFYLIQTNGYISSYEKRDDKYYITQILPVDISTDTTWMSGKDNYKVTLFNNDIVKIEFTDKEGLKYGYQLFKNSIGPSEIFTYKKSEMGEDSIKWTLSSYTGYDNIISETSNSDIEFDETDNKDDITMITTTTTTTTTSTTVTENIATNDYNADSISNYVISEISVNKTYIQIGAYSKEENAFFLLKNARDSGYDTYIFEENNNMYGKLYKVLIIISPSNEENSLYEIRNAIEKKSFIYHRGE